MKGDVEIKQKYDYKPNEKAFYDAVVVGTGVVGWATAMYCGRLGLKTLIIGEIFGGTIMLTHVVENYPGFIRVSGPELAEKLEQHARDYDIDILNDRVIKINHIKPENESVKSCFKIITSDGKVFRTKTIIFCTGTKVRKLNIPGEKEFDGRGVHYCALCDGPLYKGAERIAVIGGADSAVKEALLLTEYAKKVFIIYRGEKVHPESINMKRAEQKIKEGKLEIINKTNVIEIKGDEKVRSVILDNPYKGSAEFKVDAIFIDIGHIPLSDLAKDIGVKTNEKGEIIINRRSETNVAGVYAAGDVADTEFKQAITGVGEGVVAAYHAYKFVNENEFVCPVESNQQREDKGGALEVKSIVEKVKKMKDESGKDG